MKRMVCAVVALGLSGSAMAWGDREQGALVGLVVGSLIARGQPTVVAQAVAPAPGHGQAYAQAPVYGYGYSAPQPVVRCYQVPLVDQWGRQVGWGQQCVSRF